MDRLTYLGPPGTGKTEKLLHEVERLKREGVSLDRVGYISFTSAAVRVAADRTGRRPDDLPYFRTIHSMCFRLCGLSTSAVMQKPHYQELGEKLGIELTGNLQRRATVEELCPGDRALAIVETARAVKQDLKKTWEEIGAEDVDWLLVDLVARSLARYKEADFLVDYTGMLERYLAEGTPPPLDALIVDEAQDLSPLQWEVVDKLSAHCQQVIVAGDDDQTLYHWAGARPEKFKELTLFGEARITVLDQSWRVPRRTWELAGKIISEVGDRMKKDYSPRQAEGLLEHCASLEDVDMTAGEWLVLVRNRYMVQPVIEHCRREGYFYSCFTDSPKDWDSLRAAIVWEDLRGKKSVAFPDAVETIREFVDKKKYDRISFSLLEHNNQKTVDLGELKTRIKLTEERPWFEALSIRADEAEYLRAALRRGEHVRQTPRILIDTIHGSKGSEREHVVLFSDVSKRTFQAAEKSPDSESRVFYVGVTRARETLHVVQPATPYYFNLER